MLVPVPGGEAQGRRLCQSGAAATGEVSLRRARCGDLHVSAL